MCGTEPALVIKSKKTSSVHPEVIDNDGSMQNNAIINLDHGDPTMYEPYWKKLDHKYPVAFPVHQSLSYFSNAKNFCWFLEPELEEGIKTLHKTVGNAVFEDRHIVVGTGSSQLILAAFYALSSQLNEPDPVSVVSAAPYYSSYPEMTDHLRSGLFKWGGDARSFDKDGPYIEMVTTPNNPDGTIREPVVNRPKGMVVYDLAYYWPQYTAITSAADHDIMLFTFSKCTGHAGSRIGWALVKDIEVAKKMVKFIEINTIGVSKEAQLRAAHVLQLVSLSCQSNKTLGMENFFQYSQDILAERWKKLRDAIKNSDIFSVPKYPTQFCNYAQNFTETYSGFAWLKCKEGIDCEKLLRAQKILTRSGKRCGGDEHYARVSMLGRDEDFDLFLQRFSTMHGSYASGN